MSAKQLQRLAQHASETADGLASLAQRLGANPPARQTPCLRRSGRPRRLDSVAPELIDAAPIPALARAPAGEVGSIIRSTNDSDLLKLHHSYELEHFSRRSVLKEIEARLRRLGAPLGGPEAPLPDYDDRSIDELLAFVAESPDRHRPQVAAEIFAYEYYHQRRSFLLEELEGICGQRGRRRVEETSPSQTTAPPEPFPGYHQLRTSTSSRVELRHQLAAASEAELVAAGQFEEATRRRRTMLDEIATALRVKRR